MKDLGFIKKEKVARCPNCGSRKVAVRETKSAPGKHYHCDSCSNEWQNRVVRRYRQRKNRYEDLFKIILDKSNQLDSRDRFFVEKLQQKGNYSSRTHARLLRIAHKTGIDPRELR